jgi:hypothetical protein
MRSLLCVSALTLCAASDGLTEEQSSLMQLRIPRAAKADAHHVQLLGLDIATQEGRVALLDKVRTLAKKVADGKIDDATVELLDGAVGMAADVLREQALPAIQSQHDGAVRELDIMADNVHACASDPHNGQAAVDALGTSTQGLRGDHQTCRTEEHVVHEDQTRVCDDWSTFLSDLAEPPCPLPERAEREGVVAQLERLEHYAETYTRPATEKMEHCHAMTEELEAKRVVCNGKQVDFESSYCAHQRSCAMLSDCHEREKRAFDDFTVVVAEGVDARKLEYRTITQIQCFLDLIVQASHSGAPVGDDDLNRCGEEVNTDHLDIVPPAINPITPCDVDMMSRGACSPAFFTTEYAAMPQHETVQGLCVACPVVTRAPVDIDRTPVDIDHAPVDVTVTAAPARVSCGVPAAIPNSVTTLAELVFPQTVVVTCEHGHTTTGEPTAPESFEISCQSTGELATVGQCLPVVCGSPPALPHGSFTEAAQQLLADGATLSEVLEYRCDDGFSLDRTDDEEQMTGSVTCLPTGRFSAVAPCREIDDCIGHSCGPHGHCVDGHMEYSCVCASGFEQGEVNGELICGNVDDCGPSDCGEGGTCEDQVNDYTCNCEQGFELTELEDEKMCTRIECGEPPALENAGEQRIEKAVFEDLVVYECLEGFTTTGRADGDTSIVTECLASGEFTTLVAASASDSADGSQASCMPVTCGLPPVMPNAVAEQTEVSFGSRATYRCDEHFSTDGLPGGVSVFEVMCESTGNFGASRTCQPIVYPEPEPVSCGVPPQVGNAVLGVAGEREYGEAAVYTCPPSHSMDGSPQGVTDFSVQCQEDGTFSAAPVSTCQMITFSVQGRISNALTARAVSGAQVVLRQGSVAVTVSTNSNGIFQAQGVPTGECQMEVSVNGYITTTRTIVVSSHISSGGLGDAVVSPILPTGDWRAVLTWGESPRDLDSHVYFHGTSCHMYYARRNVRCGAFNNVRASLDRDDTSSYGPETTTISNLVTNCQGRSSCKLIYKVHNWSGRPGLDVSGATVQVFNGDREMATFNIGADGLSGGSGRNQYWSVFQLDGLTGELTTCSSAGCDQ